MSKKESRPIGTRSKSFHQPYRTYAAAERHNPAGKLIVKVGDVYLVGLSGTDKVTVMTPTGNDGEYNYHGAISLCSIVRG